MLTITNTAAKTVDEAQQLNNIDLHNSPYVSLLQEVVASFQDGILILTETGELVYANASAYRTLHQINQGTSNLNALPPVIWKLCESSLESRSLLSDQIIILSDEIVLDKSNIFRIRVRWLDLKRFSRPSLLVTIENKYESLKNVALAEAKKYDLTLREAEIWCLCRAKYSYKEIASNLFISINTVKKHIKNIHIKQQVFLSLKKST